jgi:hypothetical protein
MLRDILRYMGRVVCKLWPILAEQVVQAMVHPLTVSPLGITLQFVVRFYPSHILVTYPYIRYACLISYKTANSALKRLTRNGNSRFTVIRHPLITAYRFRLTHNAILTSEMTELGRADSTDQLIDIVRQEIPPCLRCAVKGTRELLTAVWWKVSRMICGWSGGFW